MSETTDLIVVKQLPIIEQNLRSIASEVDAQVTAALSMVCTENTYKDVKKIRSALNGQFTELEEQRKGVKAAVMGPYESFLKVYDECVSSKFKAADVALRGKINLVEDGLKDQKSEKIKAYYDEYAKSLNIGFIQFERSGVCVTMTASEKSLREACKAFLDGIADGLAMIETQEHRDEILVEFKKSLNAAQAVAFVAERHRQIEAEKERAEQRRIAEEEARQHAAEVKAATPEPAPAPVPLSVPVPQAAPVEEKVFKMFFTVHATKDKLIALKKFMDDGGYRYE